MTETTTKPTTRRTTGAKKATSAKKTTSETINKQEVQELVNNQIEESQEQTELTVGVIAVDNGGENVKVFSETMDNPIHFGSAKAKGKKKDLLDPILPPELHSYVVEWKDKIYLTNYRVTQSKYGMTGFKDSKKDDFFVLSTLIAVAKYGYDINYLCTSIPFKNWNETECDALEELYIGEHDIIIDTVPYHFEIAGVLVVAEAQAGHKHLQVEGKSTLLEIGSRTVGFATNMLETKDGKKVTDFPIREKSGTLPRKGLTISNVTDEEYEDYTSDIYAEISDIIDENDKVVAFGGGVLNEEIKKGLANEFKNITFADDPLYVQVRGMLEEGLEAFADDEEEVDAE
ncbi:ParM/StbA family protein [Lysinibacillus xylanilyticus]|uniref:ParM/StbA family protein n=1 Tax=Lysinibacillus xylanilyticus TaxID=582475 RepID=UPI003808A294